MKQTEKTVVTFVVFVFLWAYSVTVSGLTMIKACRQSFQIRKTTI